MKLKYALFFVLFALALIAAAFFFDKKVALHLPNLPHFSLQLQTPSVSSGTTAATEKLGHARLYPDSHLTPGTVFPDVVKDQICVTGYSATVRNVSIATKKAVFAEYGLGYPEPAGAYEVDHFISLELGGTNDIKNLWPEPAEPQPGFHQKDVVENYLHKQVCDNKETLQQAQQEISGDWYAVYVKIQNEQLR